MQSTVLTGIALHSLGGVAAATCYISQKGAPKWSWQTYWIIFCLTAWFLMPLVVSALTVPDLITVLKATPAGVVWSVFLLGVVYGFGGMSFAVAIRYIGFSLTYAIAIGISAVFGTVVPALMNGSIVHEFTKPGGLIVLAGFVLSMLGVALCGHAGFMKEREVPDPNAIASTFNMKKGLWLVIVAGILAGVFGVAVAAGAKIDAIASSHGAMPGFAGYPKYIILTGGTLITNLIWWGIVCVRKRTFHEFIRIEGGFSKLMFYYFMGILAGVLWFVQFIFYEQGHARMGQFKFISWGVHMAMLIFFSFIVGLVFKEWQRCQRKTIAMLALGLVVLISSFGLITYGSWVGEKVSTQATLIEKRNAKMRGETMPRYGSVIGVKEEKLEEYKRLHAAVWPDVLKMIEQCGIRNYSIYLRRLPDGRYYLFSYFEYAGNDFAGDMARMAADPTTQKWWDVCMPCQQPLPDRAEGEWWADMEEVFHCD